MPINAHLNLQQFYPTDLEIISVEENDNELKFHMI